MSELRHRGPGLDDDLVRAWDDFEVRVARQLSRMGAADQLVLELIDDAADGCAPYVQYCCIEEGTRLRAEISGNAYLRARYALDEAGMRCLRDLGWSGGDTEEFNWWMEVALADSDLLASHTLHALSVWFGTPHPQLLSYQASGPALATVRELGLCASDDVSMEGREDAAAEDDDLQDDPAEQFGPVAAMRRKASAVIAEVLRRSFGTEPQVDGDGDFAVTATGSPFWVRLRRDQPAIEIIGRAVHSVESPRLAAIEVAVLNRTSLFTTWLQHGEEIALQAVVPAQPFVPAQLEAMLEVFVSTMEAQRADLAFRTGGIEG